MKVLMINNNHFLKGGATRAYFDAISVLERNGHEVAHFSTIGKDNIFSPWERFFVKYNDLSDSSRYSFFKKICVVFRIWYNFETRKKLRALLAEFKPDIAHLHNIYHHLSPSVIDELKRHNIPIIMTLHDFKIVSPNYDLYCRGKVYDRCRHHRYYECVIDKCVKDSYWKSFVCMVEAYLHQFLGTYDKVDVFTAPSIFYAHKAKEFGFKRKIHLLPNPLLNISKPDESAEIDDKGKYFLFYGQLTQEKGIDDLIKAYARCGVKEKLLVLGDGPLRKSMEKLARNESVIEKMRFISFRGSSNEQIISLQKNALCVVSPSKCYENAPYSVLEAMSLGKAVLCSDKGGAKEMVGNGSRGFIFEQGNVDDLARTMKSIAINSDERRRRGRIARNYVKKRYSQDIFYSSLMSLYQKAQQSHNL
ncbi:MAG: glycosyltransferase family 4 protein [Patescibacteria group bacterium]|nr:glycosyltransferase family 4 protein [Patescibacteria group bacterium]